MQEFIRQMPKAELHLHIEGTFEPGLIFSIAKRNSVPLRFPSVEALSKAYDFKNLQEFLDIYYEGANVLLHPEDFRELTAAYFRKCHEQNIRHAEIMFDPQTHTDRGVPFDTVILGIRQACEDAKQQYGITSVLIMSFLRHLSAESAMHTLEEGLRYKQWIHAVGLDSSELGHPPSKFTEVFARARKEGFRLQAHAGEEGPPEYVWEALNILHVDRIDHGNRSLEDPQLVDELVKRKMALTVCPLSNLRLCVVRDIAQHPLRRMMELGLFVTINSDDPPYFGGYLNENYLAMHEALGLNQEELYTLARNSFRASWLDDATRQQRLQELETWYSQTRQVSANSNA